MAGHMGAVRVTTQNVEIARVDVEDGLVLVRGSVPGSKGTWIEIRDAVKGVKANDLPMPGKFTVAAKSAPKTEKSAPKADFVDAVVLIDGIGPKGEEALEAAGITKLTQVAAWSADDIKAIEEKIGKEGVVAKEEWVEQAKEMIGGAEPRAKVDQDLKAKMLKTSGEEE